MVVCPTPFDEEPLVEALLVNHAALLALVVNGIFNGDLISCGASDGENGSIGRLDGAILGVSTEHGTRRLRGVYEAVKVHSRQKWRSTRQ